jgi:hypothetical protein
METVIIISAGSAIVKKISDDIHCLEALMPSSSSLPPLLGVVVGDRSLLLRILDSRLQRNRDARFESE